MKRILLAVAFLAIGSANAQEFGIKGGLNISNQTLSASKTGIHIGGFINYPMNADKFSIQPEVLFSMKGSREEGVKENFNYLTVPVMVQYSINDKVYAEAGPELGFLLSATATDKSGSEDIMSDDLNRIDFGLAIGLGYRFQPNISATARYTSGLSSITKEAGIKNNVFQIGLAYTFKK